MLQNRSTEAEYGPEKPNTDLKSEVVTALLSCQPVRVMQWCKKNSALQRRQPGLADQVIAAHPHVHMLNNNAGIGAGRIGSQQRQLSQDGYELRFAVNHLAPFLLTHLLIPTLLGNGLARVVNVASAAQQAIVRWCGRASGRLKGDVEEGIRSELFVATAPEIEGIRGAYFDRTHRARAHDQAYDAQARRHLWRLSEELTGFAG